MKQLPIKKLQAQYEDTCNEYVRRFCNKQEMDFEFWVADIVGEVAVVGDFCFTMSDILIDINTRQPKHFIIKWYDEYLEARPAERINYRTYIIIHNNKTHE